MRILLLLLIFLSLMLVIDACGQTPCQPPPQPSCNSCGRPKPKPKPKCNSCGRKKPKKVKVVIQVQAQKSSCCGQCGQCGWQVFHSRNRFIVTKACLVHESINSNLRGMNTSRSCVPHYSRVGCWLQVQKAWNSVHDESIKKNSRGMKHCEQCVSSHSFLGCEFPQL